MEEGKDKAARLEIIDEANEENGETRRGKKKRKEDVDSGSDSDPLEDELTVNLTF